MHQLFFELIRIAIGTQASLSRLPSANEWNKLFELAKKQSLVGITFFGLRNLGTDSLTSLGYVHNEVYTRIGMSEETYLKWMGAAAKIHVKNEEMNHNCALIQEELSKADFDSCILKGQSLASLYKCGDNDVRDCDLSAFRQSGDIDVWVLPNIDENWEGVFHRLMKFAKRFQQEVKYTDKHINIDAFADTEVELHYLPARLNSPFANRKLTSWLRSLVVNKSSFIDVRLGLATPSLEFNLVYLLLHMFEHVMYEGIGLRQMMDYYFVLKTSSKVSSSKFQESILTIENLGLKRFAAGVMYIMQTVFGMKEDELICVADPEMGERLLSDILTGGNFGQHGNERVSKRHGNTVAFFGARMRHNMRFVFDFPGEVLWSPWCMVKHHVWKLNMNKKYAI